jgi:UDP-glucose 4-epimerase
VTTDKRNGIRRILLLGHSGFIGKWLHSAFEDLAPEVEVVGMSMSQVDLTDRAQVEELSKDIDSSTAVVIAAAIKKQLGDSTRAFSQNMKIMQNLCEVFEKCRAKRIIYFSSSAVYGEDVHNMAISEGTPVCPRSFYGIAKYASECLLQKVVRRQDECSLLVLRPPLIYGPGDMSESYGPTGFVAKALRQEPIPLWGDGTEKRCFLYINDLAQMTSQLTFSRFSGVLNVVNSVSHTFEDALDIIGDLVSSGLEISSRARSQDKVDNVFDNSKLVDVIGDFTFTSLPDGVKQTMESLKANSE